jgi:hypothetical protein
MQQLQKDQIHSFNALMTIFEKRTTDKKKLMTAFHTLFNHDPKSYQAMCFLIWERDHPHLELSNPDHSWLEYGSNEINKAFKTLEGTALVNDLLLKRGIDQRAIAEQREV